MILLHYKKVVRIIYLFNVTVFLMPPPHWGEGGGTYRFTLVPPSDTLSICRPVRVACNFNCITAKAMKLSKNSCQHVNLCTWVF